MASDHHTDFWGGLALGLRNEMQMIRLIYFFSLNMKTRRKGTQLAWLCPKQNLLTNTTKGHSLRHDISFG